MTTKPVNNALSTAQRNKEQAIYLGLQSVLSKAQALEVLEKWSGYFRGTGSLFGGLNSFSREVCLSYGIVEQQRDLLRALRHALLNLEQPGVQSMVETIVEPMAETIVQLAAASASPLYLVESTSQPLQPTVNAPEFSTFQSLLLEIMAQLAQLESDLSVRLHQFLDELIHSMPWSESHQHQLLDLINTGKTTLVRSYLPDQLKAFLKHLRSWIEGEIGAIAANRLITQALAKIQALPVNTHYAVKKLV